jgi:hypothetical protein
MMRNAIGMLLLSILAGCTDVERSRMATYGAEATVQCFSGGVLIYDGRSTGTVDANVEFTGFEFREAESGAFVRIRADCVVRYEGRLGP